MVETWETYLLEMRLRKSVEGLSNPYTVIIKEMGVEFHIAGI